MNKSEEIIGWDADGVLVNSQNPIIEETNRRLGTNFTFEQWLTYTYLFDQAIALTGDSPNNVASWMFSIPIMLASTPYPEALAVSRQLDELGFRQIVITSRPTDQTDVTIEWFKTYYPWINSGDINVRKSGFKMSGEEFKVKKIQELTPVAFSDDSDELITLLLAQISGMPTHLTLSLVDRPWNRHAKHLNAQRITSFDSILKKLKQD